MAGDDPHIRGCPRGSTSRNLKLLGVAAIAGGFTGLQEVVPLYWIQQLLVLRFFSRQRVASLPWHHACMFLVVVIASQAAASFLGYASMYNDTNNFFASSSIVPAILSALYLWSAYSLIFLADTAFRSTYINAFHLHPLVFPLLTSSLWSALQFFSPVGVAVHPFYTLLTLRPLVLATSLVGMDAVAFTVTWLVAALHQLLWAAHTHTQAHSHSHSPTLTRYHCCCPGGASPEVNTVGRVSEEEQAGTRVGDAEAGGVTSPLLPSLLAHAQLPRQQYAQTQEQQECTWSSSSACTTAPATSVSSPHCPSCPLFTSSPSSSPSPSSSWRLTAMHAARQHVWLSSLLLLLLLLAGSARDSVFGRNFFQRSLEDVIPPSVPVSCVISQPVSHSLEPQAHVEQLALLRTSSRLSSGDVLVLWSEMAVTLAGDRHEAQLLAAVQRMVDEEADRRRQAAAAVGNSGEVVAGPYVGVSYKKVFSHPLGAYDHSNSFALLGPHSPSPLLAYNKSHPVPVEESSAAPGRPAVMRSVDLPVLGRVGVAICFDLQFPTLIRQAGRAGVDLLLQPSWTYGAVFERAALTDAVRAPENGFTLFRCSSVGLSLMANPQFQITWQRPALKFDVLTAFLPLLPHTWAPSAFLALPLALLTACLAATLTLLLLLPPSLVAVLLLHLPALRPLLGMQRQQLQ